MPIRDEFKPHVVTPEGLAKIEEIRAKYSALMTEIETYVLDGDQDKAKAAGRTLAVAKTNLEQSSHWAVRAIATAHSIVEH